MRKRIIRPLPNTTAAQLAWLDLETIAAVDLTSEDSAFPIESALMRKGKQGWRASGPGLQTIRLVFDQPQNLTRIALEFVETDVPRTQEFTLKWSPDGGTSFQEIVRQQWNFSSPDSTRETENYTVGLSNVTILDLTIDPDKENGKACASLLSLRVA
jgi:hypothetical protein